MAKVHNIFKLGEHHEVPVGGSFAPSGWIAPFQAAHVYAVGWVEMDLALLAKDEAADLTTALGTVDEETGKTFAEVLSDDGSMPLFDDASKSRSEKFKYYYKDYDRAAALSRLLDAEEPALSRAGKKFTRRPEHRFRLETTVSDTLSLSDDAKAKFENDVVSWEVEMKALQKNSPSWFDWHGLALPGMVAAYADLMGWETSGFDISELLVQEDQLIVTDKLQLELIGNTDVGYESSAFFVRRKLLWQQLGEDDPKVSNPDDTESEKLAAALAVATSNWNAPVYCRVVQVPSPKVDDVWEGQNGKVRSKIPVVTAFYKSEKEAGSAADAEREERTAEAESAPKAETGASDNGKPAVPEAWESVPDDWTTTVKALKDEIGVRPAPVLKKVLEERAEQLASELMVTPDDVMAWWDQV